MNGKQVTIARHTFFYKTFFVKHKEFLEELTKITYTSLHDGFKKLNVFYASYSYYLKEDDKDNYLKDLIVEKLHDLNKDKLYNDLSEKIRINGLGSLSYSEIYELNLNYDKYLRIILEIFEIFCYRFAPSDIFPKIASNMTEYDLNLIFVVYDTFYESLFNLHAKIHSKLLDFNIIEFIEIFKILMVFFYGYSYYLQKDTIQIIKNQFELLHSYYNDQIFLEVYFNLIQGNVNENSMNVLKEYKNNMFNTCMNIYELINADLPKSNLFPKRTERITTDLTLI